MFYEIIIPYIQLIQDIHEKQQPLIAISPYQREINSVLTELHDLEIVFEEYSLQMMKKFVSFANYSVPQGKESSVNRKGPQKVLNSKKPLAQTSKATSTTSSKKSTVLWKDILRKKLDLTYFILDQSCPEILKEKNGSFFVRYFSFEENKKEFISFYQILGGKDREMEQLINDMNELQLKTTAAVTSELSKKPVSSSQPQQQQQQKQQQKPQLPPPTKDMIDNIKSIFPDLGEGFIESCLLFYKNNSEELIDALLMDNLHPSLSSLDRKMMKISIGKNTIMDSSKGASALQTTVPSTQAPADKQQQQKNEISSEILFQKNDGFYQQNVQKQFLQNQERKLKYEAYLLDKMYDDDYDDQYDESIAWKGHPTSLPTGYEEEQDEEEREFHKLYEDKDRKAAAAAAPAGGGGKKVEKDWEIQMRETKR
jgi:hypothetical protein